MDIETQLKEELQSLTKMVDQYDRWSFFSDRWSGTKEQLNEFRFFLEELNSRRWIELKIEPYHGGELYQVKITPKGYMKCKELKEK